MYAGNMEAIYDRIGIEYDTTRRTDPVILSRLASLLVLDKSRKYVDIACGTGNYTSELANLGGEWSAFDHFQKGAFRGKMKIRFSKLATI